MATPLNHSLLKGFEILGLFSRDRPEITAQVVVDELGTNAATAHRFLATLEEAGAVSPVRRGVYRLSHRAAELGRVAEATNPLLGQVQPVLDQLAADLGESVMACRLARRGPVSVAVATAPRAFAMGFRVGTLLGLGNTAQGRLFLAWMAPADRAALVPEAASMAGDLDEIRRAGVAQNTGTAEPDVGAVAVPVVSGGAVILTLSMFGPLGRFTPDLRARAAPRLQAAAADLARRLQR